MAALACALDLTGAAAQAPPSHQHGFGDAQRWSQVLDDPQRDAWQKPHEVIQALALQPNAVIADIGAGTGYFTVRLARMLPKARVYGVDTEPDMVRYVAERAKREGLPNVVAVAARPDDPRLPEKVDLALLVDVYHHIADRPRYLRKLRESLRPGGRVAVVDFRPDAQMGPPASARIAPQKVKAEAEAAGLVPVREHAFLPSQYFLIFTPAR